MAKDARYEKEKERVRRHLAGLSLSGRDIGRLPPVRNPRRKQSALGDFRYLCETYFPNSFTLKFSADHLKGIARIERAVLRGGLFAFAMPRGTGKSTLAEVASLWAVISGARPFVCLIGSDEGHAVEMLDSIKNELKTNPLLLEDFPEVVYPVHCLEEIAQRATGQLYDGKPTRMNWTAKQMILPTIAGSPASGAVIRVAGITGRIRGMKHKLANGTSIRPSLVVLDDPQTDESARSPVQCETRERTLAGAVLGLAGPGEAISGIMPCTVIYPGDMADNILDRDKHPQWQGVRTKMVYAFPSNETLWTEYQKIRDDSFRAGGDGAEATDYYRRHRAAMDKGAKVAWPERFNEDELSALQHAMNLKLRDEAAFFAEFQNQPLDPTEDEEFLTADAIAKKTNGYKRRAVPAGCNYVTMFIDVHDKLLYYVLAAWAEDFSGHLIDYGTYPKQPLAYFTMRQAKRTLGRKFPGTGREGAVYAGLEALTTDYLDREFRRQDGTVLQIGRCLIDSGYMPTTIEQYIRAARRAPVLMQSLGRSIKAGNKPFSEYERKQGDKNGHYFRIPAKTGTRMLRTVHMDVNYWKSRVHRALAVAPGDRGGLDLFDSPDHRLCADHMKAEYRVQTEGHGRKLDEWDLPAHQPDNHWFDGLVGCAVAASMLGVTLRGTERAKPRTRKRITQAEARARN